MLYQFILKRYIPVNGIIREWSQILVVLFAALGYVSTAALLSWTSPSIPILVSNASHMDIVTIEEASYLTVIPLVTAVLVCPFLAVIVDNAGRKNSILLMTIFHILTWLLTIFAKNIITLYVSKIFQGIARAIMCTAVPMYIAEIAQPKIRVSWGSTYPSFAFVGQFIMNLIGAYLDIPTTAFVIIWIPLIQFVLILLIPESPYFYIKQNNRQGAEMSLKILRWTGNVEEELDSISKNTREPDKPGTYKDLFTVSTIRRGFLVACGVRAFQIMSGVQTFIAWSQYIFLFSGSDFSASTSTIIYTGLLMLVMFTFNVFTRKFGRIPLMILSSLTCATILGILSIYFYLHEKTNVDVSFLSWVPLAGMILHIPASSLGLNFIPSVLCAELLPLNVKGKATSLLNTVYFTLNFIVNKLFQVLFTNFGMYLPFALFTFFCFMSALYFYYCVPETQGKTLTEIQDELSKRDDRQE